MCEMWQPSGPIENGTTYIVRPRMQPSNRPSSVLRISAGAIQLLVGPASSSRSQQMKVRSSTRATSLGSERARKLFGRFAGLSRVSVPARDQLRAQAVVLLLAAVAPDDPVGLGQRRHVAHPRERLLVMDVIGRGDGRRQRKERLGGIHAGPA